MVLLQWVRHIKRNLQKKLTNKSSVCVSREVGITFMTVYGSEDIKLYGGWSQMTMDRAEGPLDFNYADGEFYANEMSFEILKKFFETKNDTTC